MIDSPLMSAAQPSSGPLLGPSSHKLIPERQPSNGLLGSVAVALEAAARQRAILLAEVHTARQSLHDLADRRVRAEVALAATRAQVDAAVRDLVLARARRGHILSKVERALATGLERRGALEAEVTLLQRRRDELAGVLADFEALVPAGAMEAVNPIPLVGVARTSLDGVVVRTDVLAPDRSATAPPQLAPRQLSTFGVTSSGRVRGPGRAHLIHPNIRHIVLGSFFAVLFGAALLLTPLTQVFGGLQLLAVTSGSMAPAIPVGSAVAIRPVSAADLSVGDAITFVEPSNPDVLVTHRIVDLEPRAGETMLTTRGDANNAADSVEVPASRTVGRVIVALPLLGYLMVGLGSPLAKIGIVILTVLGLGLSSRLRSRVLPHG